MTEGVELATAYVSLTVSARGIEADLRREIGRPIEQASEQASRAARGNIESQLAKTRPDFDQIGKSLQSAATEATAKAKATISKGLDDVVNKSSDRLGNGLQLLTGAGVATLGLKKLADAAGDYGEQQSKANVILGKEGAAAAEKFAASATKSAGLSKTAALQATSTFAGLGKVAGLQNEELSGFSTGLTQLAGDLASFNNTTVDDAIAAIGSGLRGEAEPLRAFNVLLDDATLKQSAMNLGISDGTSTLTTQQKVLAAHAAILAQTTDAQGDFVRTGDSFANQQRKLTAEVENLKIELGQGLLPIASKAVGAISGLVGVVSEAPTPVKDLGLGFVTVVTGLAGIAGIGSTAAGVAGKVVERLTDIDASADGSGRSLNKTGKAVAGLSAAFAAFAIADTVGNVLNDIGQVEKKAALLADELKLTLASGGNAGSVFGDIVQNENDTFRLSNLYEDFGDKIVFTSLGIGTSIETVQRAFDSLDPTQAVSVLDQLQAENDKLDKDSNRYKVNQRFIDENRKALETHTKAAATDTKTIDVHAQAVDIASAAYESANKALEDYNKNLKINSTSYDAGDAAASGFADAIARSTRVDDQLGGAVSLSKANEEFRTSLSKLPKDIDVASIALGKYNEEQNTAISSLLSASQASTTYLSTLIAQGNYTGARDQATQLRDAYLEQLQTIGITGAAAQEYIEILGLAPEQVETAILLSGMEEAKFKLETYIALLGPEGIPRDIATEVAMKIRDGDIGGAAKQLEDAIAFMQYIADQNEIKISTRLRPEEDKPNRGRPSIPFRAMGGPVAADRPYIVGEIGPELFVPKAAGAIIPNKDLLTAANGGGTRPAPVINQHITNAGYQETLEATVNGLRAAEVMGY